MDLPSIYHKYLQRLNPAHRERRGPDKTKVAHLAFQALSGRPKFTVRRHTSNKDLFAPHSRERPEALPSASARLPPLPSKEGTTQDFCLNNKARILP